MNNEKKQIILSALNEYPHLAFADLAEKTQPATGQTNQQLSMSLHGYKLVHHVHQEHDTKNWFITDKGVSWLKAAIDKPNETPPVQESNPGPAVVIEQDQEALVDEFLNQHKSGCDTDSEIDPEIDTMVELFKVMESRVHNGLNSKQVYRISIWFKGCYGD